jgi:hypothetical protein
MQITLMKNQKRVAITIIYVLCTLLTEADQTHTRLRANKSGRETRRGESQESTRSMDKSAAGAGVILPRSSVVDPPAVLPDLAGVPGERRDVAHLDHGLGELLEEEALVGGEAVDELHGLAALREQDLVGGEQAVHGEDVAVVLVVEAELGNRVEREQVLVAARRRAPPAQLRGVGGVQRPVHLPVVVKAVQALPEADAAGVTDGVRAGERDEVGDVQALVAELVHDGG